MKQHCKKCNREWNYKGKKKPTSRNNVYISCPTCRANLKLKKEEVIEEVKEGNDGIPNTTI